MTFSIRNLNEEIKCTLKSTRYSLRLMFILPANKYSIPLKASNSTTANKLVITRTVQTELGVKYVEKELKSV